MLKKSTLLFVSIFVLLFIGLSDYGYGCHRRDEDGKRILHGNVETCEDSDSGGKTAGTTVTTTVQWGGDIGGNITEAAARPCFALQVANNDVYGLYTCQQCCDLRVYYDLTDIPVQQTARNGNGSLCSVFDGILLNPGRLYNYGWDGNCFEDDMCTIQISNWFGNVNNQVTNATGGLADDIKFRAFAVAEGPVDGFQDVNPFADSLTLYVDEINITFFATGSGKTIANCHYTPEQGDLTLDNVIFQSDPD